MKKKKVIMVYVLPTILFISLVIFKEVFNLNGILVSGLLMVIILLNPVLRAIAKDEK